MTSLLPINSTPLERALEAANAGDTSIVLRTLYNPATCPVHLLPQLAWAWSVDRWDPRWSETVKRNAIRAAHFIHARKGTIGALRRVVEPLGYLIEVVEWWQTVPSGEPATFALKVGVLDTGITEEMYQELTRLIDDAKPVSRHMTGLAISLETSGVIGYGAYVDQGEVIDVYPPAPRDIEVTGRYGQVVCIDEIDTLDVYP
ncbi:phage tail protein I [Pseudomonas protegens]|jgi:phage tail P2-like protein|uniref:Phage tail protein I n=2 Tax=Pseudomonas protegens TaxID=380021 RepID=Q4KF58_PSEF5|nr:phage tail protein I [Pseudomonas protegens]AAY91292.1 phage tail protein I [Pseudomonas protegens Pf-5]ASE24451.1 phage tail protein I [Pseudomonas protegens]QEZ51906.1 phage tail protein I [Pseudomonas protegens]QEZ56024.1 phage tail protein I [Pseudomonas protegens]QEZ63166.1 phage tail protein I [Pseudomonas protegens]